MNKASFHFAFMAVLASTLSGCASPMRLFAKKSQPFEEFKAQQQAEQARIASSRTATGGPAEVSELLHQAHAAYQQGNQAEAQAKYSAVLQRQPNHPVANHRLGVIADRQQDYRTAQQHYFAALNSSPNDPSLLNDIGYSFLLQSRFPEAENYLQAALQKNPKHSFAIENLGKLYAKQGQPDRALAMFRLTNGEAEAQAKLTRLMPSGMNSSAQGGTMLAQQGWPPQNPAAMNAPPFNPNAYNPNPNNVAPPNPAFAANRNGQPQMPPPNSAGNGWTPPDLTPPSNSSPSNTSPIAQTSAAIDPNIPEPTRRLMEEMESLRLKAVSERQTRDNAARQRQEMLKRQLREEEISRASIVNPVYSQPSGANRWNGAPNSTAPNPNAPIVIGPPPNPNVPNSTQWQATPDGQSFSNSAAGPAATGAPQGMPNTGTGSPLDAMPTWPSPGSLPTITPNNSAAGISPTNPGPNNGAWPNGFAPGMADDPARAASRMGMNAGSGNPFQITPGPSSGATNAPNGNNSPNTFNNFGPPNGVSPTTPPNWPANSIPPNYGAPAGEPPEGTFGSRGSVDDQGLMTTERLPQDQLPPSAWYQTPGRFGEPPTGTTQTQPASYGTQRYAAGANTADRFNGDERWANGQMPGTQSGQASTPAMQSYLATPMGENSLQDYERMIQLQNAETNRIRQQLDEQRQLPPSENFRRNNSQSQPSPAPRTNYRR